MSGSLLALDVGQEVQGVRPPADRPVRPGTGRSGARGARTGGRGGSAPAARHVVVVGRPGQRPDLGHRLGEAWSGDAGEDGRAELGVATGVVEQDARTPRGVAGRRHPGRGACGGVPARPACSARSEQSGDQRSSRSRASSSAASPRRPGRRPAGWRPAGPGASGRWLAAQAAAAYRARASTRPPATRRQVEAAHAQGSDLLESLQGRDQGRAAHPRRGAAEPVQGRLPGTLGDDQQAPPAARACSASGARARALPEAGGRPVADLGHQRGPGR